MLLGTLVRHDLCILVVHGPDAACLPAWQGFRKPTPSDDTRMIHILRRLHYFSTDRKTFEKLCNNVYIRLHGAVLMDPGQVLRQLLPPTKSNHYSSVPVLNGLIKLENINAS